MALRTLGQRTFAALTFGALTLHGVATVTPSGSQLSGGSGGGRVGIFGKAYPGYDRVPSVPKAPLVIDIAQQLQEDDEETIITTVLLQAVMHYYT